MTDFTPFIAHTILEASQLDAALTGIDNVAVAAKAEAAQAEADAQAGITAATGAASVAGAAETLATQAEMAAQAAQTAAAAAIPESAVGQSVAPLVNGAIPAQYLPAPAAASGGGYDAYVVFRGYAATEGGVYVPSGVVTSKGVSSVDDHGNGVFRINLSPAAPNNNFIVAALGKWDSLANDNTLSIICEPRQNWPAGAVAPNGPTSGPDFLEVLGGYQASGTSSPSQLLLYRIGITFVS